MIIKFQNYDGTWQLFDDVDSLNYSIIGTAKEDECFSSGTIFFTGEDEPHTNGMPYEQDRVWMSCVNSKQLEAKIVAFAPVFIMNNEGRTIETIR